MTTLTLKVSILLSSLFAVTAVVHADEINTGPMQLIEVADRVYAVAPTFAGANGALILNETGHIVVDTHGTPASAQAWAWAKLNNRVKLQLIFSFSSSAAA